MHVRNKDRRTLGMGKISFAVERGKIWFPERCIDPAGINNKNRDTVSEHQIMEPQITEHRITKHRITERRITKDFRTSNSKRRLS